MPLRLFTTTLVVAAAVTVPTAASVPAPGTAGIGDGYFPLDGNGGFDVAHYDIHNRYSFDRRVLRGWTTITAIATQDLSRFNLDILLPVSRVTVNGATATFSRPHPHELTVRPATPITAGSPMRVVVRYAGRPSAYSYLRNRNWLEDGREAAAVFEPHIAPWWYAANDHPRDKATYTINLTVPRGRQALSNGRLVSIRRRGSLTTWRWEMRQPMASYLAFMVVGRFAVERETVGGIRMVYAVSRQLPTAVQQLRMRQLKRSAQVTQWFSARVGPYPFVDGGGIALKLPFFAALENQTRPVYGLAIPARSVVVHEVAHQWVGNHVSIHRWRDIWLNEGFATYLEWWYDASHGGLTLQQRFNLFHSGFAVDQAFWTVPIGNPGARRLFTAPVYFRGAMALVALRNRIGVPAMETLLRRWIAERGGSTGTTEQFIALAEEVSGQDLSAFFTMWLFTPERPPVSEQFGIPASTARTQAVPGPMPRPTSSPTSRR